MTVYELFVLNQAVGLDYHCSNSFIKLEQRLHEEGAARNGFVVIMQVRCLGEGAEAVVLGRQKIVGIHDLHDVPGPHHTHVALAPVEIADLGMMLDPHLGDLVRCAVAGLVFLTC